MNDGEAGLITLPRPLTVKPSYVVFYSARALHVNIHVFGFAVILPDFRRGARAV